MNKMNILTALIVFIPGLMRAQINPVISGGFGYELQHKAIPAQLMLGASAGRSEVTAGYTVWLHRADATIPKLYTIRYAINILNEELEVRPMIGYSLLSKTVQDSPSETLEKITEPSTKPLIGIKLQKMVNNAGLFISYEHCSMDYITTGMIVKFTQ